MLPECRFFRLLFIRRLVRSRLFITFHQPLRHGTAALRQTRTSKNAPSTIRPLLKWTAVGEKSSGAGFMGT